MIPEMRNPAQAKRPTRGVTNTLATVHKQGDETSKPTWKHKKKKKRKRKGVSS